MAPFPQEVIGHRRDSHASCTVDNNVTLMARRTSVSGSDTTSTGARRCTDEGRARLDRFRDSHDGDRDVWRNAARS